MWERWMRLRVHSRKHHLLLSSLLLLLLLMVMVVRRLLLRSVLDRSHRLGRFLSNSRAMLATCRASSHIYVNLKWLVVVALARIVCHIELSLHVLIDLEVVLLSWLASLGTLLAYLLLQMLLVSPFNLGVAAMHLASSEWFAIGVLRFGIEGRLVTIILIAHNRVLADSPLRIIPLDLLSLPGETTYLLVICIALQ